MLKAFADFLMTVLLTRHQCQNHFRLRNIGYNVEDLTIAPENGNLQA